jgi:SRSO17 transposase
MRRCSVTLEWLTLARDDVPVPVGLRLFLPESWTSVREPKRISRTKPDITHDEIYRLIATGVRFGTVLGYAGYGLSAGFRQRLSARDLVAAGKVD